MRPRFNGGVPAITRSQKITFGEMRSTGVRGVLVYSAELRYWKVDQ